MEENGRNRLAYYLYLHRAAYGPRALAALDPKEPERWGHGLLEAEAAVLRLETLHAAKRPEEAGIKAAILERWPGLAWRIHDIDEGHGLMTVLRTVQGIERSEPPKDRPAPYR